jgi:hypothetical protein
MSSDETQARLAEIDDKLHRLQDLIETCRKGMLLSRAAILAGAILFLLNLAFASPPSLVLGLVFFTAIIAGIVWLGANKSSREQALADLRVAQAEWQAATDAIEMETIGQ